MNSTGCTLHSSSMGQKFLLAFLVLGEGHMETCVQKYSSDCSRLLELQYPYASRLPAIEALRQLYVTSPHTHIKNFLSFL